MAGSSRCVVHVRRSDAGDDGVALETRSCGAAVDERPAVQETRAARRRRRNCLDPARLCAYIGADPLTPVCNWNRC